MSVVSLKTNIASLQAQRQLRRSSEELGTNLTRLSSGMRINRASDDAAGIAIASRLSSDSRVYGQAIRNANDGISALNIADGAAAELTGVLTRLKELSVSAANGTYSRTQRLSLDAEASELVKEFNRLVSTSKFNKRALLDGTLGDLGIQLGYGSSGNLNLAIGSEIQRTAGTGTFQAAVEKDAGYTRFTVMSGDFNGDGHEDIFSALDDYSEYYIQYGDGNGNFAQQTYADGPYVVPPYAQIVDDFNGDGKADIASGAYGGLNIYLGNGNGTFQSAISTASSVFHSSQTADLNGDGKLDIVGANAGGSIEAYLGNGNGSFTLSATLSSGVGFGRVALADLNNDGRIDIVNSASDGTVNTFLGSGTGTFGPRSTLSGYSTPNSIALSDLNQDGIVDLLVAEQGASRINVKLGNGSGGFGSATTYATASSPFNILVGDLNGDGIKDVTVGSMASGANLGSVFLGSGTGTLGARSAIEIGQLVPNLELVDFNEDGVLDLLAGANESNIYLLFGNTRQTSTMAQVNLTTRQDALDSLATIEEALQRISSERATIGSSQSRLYSAVSTLSDRRMNYLAARSRIVDADVAVESAKLVTNQIRQQVATAVIGQANLIPQLSLTLLGN